MIFKENKAYVFLVLFLSLAHGWPFSSYWATSGEDDSKSSEAERGRLGTTSDTTLPAPVSGEATFNSSWTSPSVACDSERCPDDGWCAAIPAQYTKDPCGRCIKVVHEDKAIVVRVTDTCSTCGDANVELSAPAFEKLTGSQEKGKAKVQWAFVDCGGRCRESRKKEKSKRNKGDKDVDRDATSGIQREFLDSTTAKSSSEPTDSILPKFETESTGTLSATGTKKSIGPTSTATRGKAKLEEDELNGGEQKTARAESKEEAVSKTVERASTTATPTETSRTSVEPPESKGEQTEETRQIAETQTQKAHKKAIGKKKSKDRRRERRHRRREKKSKKHKKKTDCCICPCPPDKSSSQVNKDGGK